MSSLELGAALVRRFPSLSPDNFFLLTARNKLFFLSFDVDTDDEAFKPVNSKIIILFGLFLFSFITVTIVIWKAIVDVERESTKADNEVSSNI